MEQPSILIVDDEEAICRMITMMLTGQGYRIVTATDFSTAKSLIEKEEFDLIFFDIMLGRSRNGLDLLRRIRELSQTGQVVIMTGYPDIETASEATRLGANDYICKPFDTKQITDIARHTIEKRKLMLEREKYRANLEAIFNSMQDALVMVDRKLSVLQTNRHAIQWGYPADGTDRGCSLACGQALAETVRTGRPQELKRVECPSDAGPQRVVNITTAPIIGPDGQIDGGVAIIHDETKLYTLEASAGHRDRLHRMVGDSEAMQRLYNQIEALADVSSTVLICGESGTGKELVAAALHECGSRKNRPFVAINCAAISDSLLESELFGHARGAFTGAVSDRPGKFRKAHGGTIFLDEIGDISPAMQLRLLRVLQEHEVEPVGSNRTIKVDVRVIAATNRNMQDKVQRGEFRHDLYYRLNVVQLNTPALRDRLEEIPLLSRHFLDKFSLRFNKQFTEISSDLLALLQKYHWPGNIRELEHILEHACIMSNGPIITSDLLPNEFMERLRHHEAHTAFNLPILMDTDSSTDTDIGRTIKKCGGNKTEAAKMLGISRRTVYRWLEKNVTTNDHVSVT